VARDKGKDYVILDDNKSKPYDLCGMLVFSPNCRHFAFVATKNPGAEFVRSFVVLDGVEGKDYSDIPSEPLFSPDSKRVAYKAKDDDKQLVVVDGIEGPRHEYLGQLVFSPDSKRFAYVAQDHDGFRVIVDGRRGPTYDLILGLVFSADSYELVYKASSEKSWVLIVDRFAKREQHRIVDFASPVAYSKGRFAWVESTGGQEMLAVDGKYWQSYDKIESVVFSPNGKRLACHVRQKRKEFIVVDGVEGKKYDFVGLPIFSPDSAHVAHIAVSGEEYRIVMDSVEGRRYDHIGPKAPEQHALPFTFTPDSRVTYWALNGDKWYLVMGSEELWHCDEFVLGDVSPLYWDKEGCLYTLGVRSQQILLVEVRFAGITITRY
jgi:hypothetical protein